MFNCTLLSDTIQLYITLTCFINADYLPKLFQQGFKVVQVT